MSPSIDITPDLLGMFKQQESPVPASAAADLETLCSAIDMLQSSGQTDLKALAGCLSSLSDWLINQPEAAQDDVSGWTSEPFGVKGMGGMLTCRSDQWEVIFNQDGSGQPYMGMWHSRVSEKANHNGSFKIQDGDGGMQLLIEGSRPLQIFLPELQPDTWGSMDTFYQKLINSRPPKTLTDVSSPPSPQQEKAVTQYPPSMPDVDFSSNDAPTILASSARQLNKSISPPTEISDQKPPLTEQPAISKPDVWQCVCGNKNAGPVCLKCGKEKPASASVEMSAPVQKLVCSQCGGVLSKGAKFCRHCGQETGW